MACRSFTAFALSKAAVTPLSVTSSHAKLAIVEIQPVIDGSSFKVYESTFPHLTTVHSLSCLTYRVHNQS